MTTPISIPMKVCLLCVAFASLFAGLELRAQEFQYPPYGAWRGRMVARDGLFHVQRYHWGGGLTPTGGAFLTSAVSDLAPLLVSLAGARDLDADSRSSETARFDAREDYIREQRRANDLLERTASIVVSSSGPTPNAVPAITQPVTPTAQPNTNATLEDLMKVYNAGSNPFTLKKNE